MVDAPRATPLVYVKYRDHVLFRNADPMLFNSNLREVVGWLIKEIDTVLVLTYDRSVELLPFEKRNSGFAYQNLGPSEVTIAPSTPLCRKWS